jgi:hypothetical protein
VGFTLAFWTERRVLCAATAIALLVGAVLTATQFPAAGNDDSHITYWTAFTLSEYGAIVNYNGVALEQSSSLLLVVLLAAIRKVSGVEPPTAAWLLSLASAALCVVMTARLARKVAPNAEPWAPLLLGSFLPFLYWSSSGMEMTLTGLLGVVVVDRAGAYLTLAGKPNARMVALLALAIVAFALVRPETPIVLLCMLALAAVVEGFDWWRGRAGAGKQPTRRALEAFALALVVTLVIAGCRKLAFGTWVPNPAAIKSGGFDLSAGSEYLWKGLSLGNVWFALAALVGVVWLAVSLTRGRVPAEATLVLGFGLAYVAFVSGSGGDWMPGARLVVPVAPAFALLATYALARVGAQQQWAGLAAAALLVGLNLKQAHAFGASRSNGSYRGEAAHEGAEGLPARAPAFAFSELGNRAHRRDAHLLAALLELTRRIAPTPERPLYIMSGQAGMVPYYVFREHYGAARFIDLFSLTAPEILPCIPANRQNEQIHGIRLSPDYIVRHADEMPEECHARRPQIVFSPGAFPNYLRKLGYVEAYRGRRGVEAFVALDGELAHLLKDRK